MSGWSNADVTPVGWQPGAGAGSGPASPPAGAGGDPFGSRPTRRRRGWIRIVAGAVLLVAGIAAAVAGILSAVAERDRIETEAVARGVIRDGEPGTPLTFRAREGGEYTVYLIFAGKVGNTTREERAVRDTACTAARPDGTQTDFRGSRQGVATTIGRASSVGHFSTPPGGVAIRCEYAQGSRRSRRLRTDAVAFVVTPGAPSFFGGGVLTIVGGVFAGLAGGFLLGWGLIGKRVPV